ncbi:MAG: hypothetical protein ACI97A_003661, partial [Planctomycetota bacterium]
RQAVRPSGGSKKNNLGIQPESTFTAKNMSTASEFISRT